MRTTHLSCFAALLSAGLAVVPCSGQTFGEITGVVTDPVGGVVVGTVVNAPIATSAHPAPFRASLLNRSAINRPNPTPNATRVPAISAISGTVSVRSIISSPINVDASGVRCIATLLGEYSVGGGGGGLAGRCRSTAIGSKKRRPKVRRMSHFPFAKHPN